MKSYKFNFIIVFHQISSGVLQPRMENEPDIGNSPFFAPDDLNLLLSTSEIGQSILRSSLKGPLSKDSKKELASIIANHHISRHSQGNNVGLCRLTKAVLENYVNCIKLRFPTEKDDMVRVIKLYL